MEQQFNSTFSLLDKINFLQRKIILNSILYYEYDLAELDDMFYDGICEQLRKYQEIFMKHHDIMETRYGYAYYDFDGFTGYHLYSRLTEDDKRELQIITNFHMMKTY